jgi:hypothetical protein
MSGPSDEEYEDHPADCVDDDDCWNCGGEGFVSNCFEEFACLDPEGGCDLCTKRCDVCNLPKRIPDPSP